MEMDLERARTCDIASSSRWQLGAGTREKADIASSRIRGALRGRVKMANLPHWCCCWAIVGLMAGSYESSSADWPKVGLLVSLAILYDLRDSRGLKLIIAKKKGRWGKEEGEGEENWSCRLQYFLMTVKIWVGLTWYARTGFGRENGEMRSSLLSCEGTDIKINWVFYSSKTRLGFVAIFILFNERNVFWYTMQYRLQCLRELQDYLDQSRCSKSLTSTVILIQLWAQAFWYEQRCKFVLLDIDHFRLFAACFFHWLWIWYNYRARC